MKRQYIQYVLMAVLMLSVLISVPSYATENAAILTPALFGEVVQGDNIISGTIDSGAYQWHFIDSGSIQAQNVWTVDYKAQTPGERKPLQLTDLNNYWIVTNQTSFTYQDDSYVFINGTWAFFDDTVQTSGFWMTNFESGTDESQVWYYIKGDVRLSDSWFTTVSGPESEEEVVVNDIRLNGDLLNADYTYAVERGESLNIELELEAFTNVDDIQVTAEFYGYEHPEDGLTFVSSNPVTLESGDKINVNLALEVPLDAQSDVYPLVITVADKEDIFVRQSYDLRVSGTQDELFIRDVIFSNESVLAGRSLLTQVQLENIGGIDLDNVKVIVRIPALDLSESVYINQIKSEEIHVSEELNMQIPECAAEGVYTVKIYAEFNEYETVFTTEQIIVIANDLCDSDSTSLDLVSDLTPNTITDVTRSNPRERGDDEELDHESELEYESFVITVPTQATYDITSVSVDQTLSIFDGIDLTGDVADKSVVTFSKTTATPGESITVSVLIAPDLDAIDNSFEVVEYTVPVTVVTTNGTSIIDLTFTVENMLSLDEISIEGFNNYDCDIEDDSVALDCDDELEELGTNEDFDVIVQIENIFRSSSNMDFEDVELEFDSDNGDVDPDDSSLEFDLDADEKTEQMVSFDVNADDKDDATIEITGFVRDENGARHGFRYEFDVEFDEDNADENSASTRDSPTRSSTRSTSTQTPDEFVPTTQTTTTSTTPTQDSGLGIVITQSQPPQTTQVVADESDIPVVEIVLWVIIVLLVIAILSLIIYIARQ